MVENLGKHIQSFPIFVSVCPGYVSKLKTIHKCLFYAPIKTNLNSTFHCIAVNTGT